MRVLFLIITVSFVQLIALALTCAAQVPSTQPVDLFGKVVSPDNKPVAGAKISLTEYKAESRAYATSATATSDAQGQFKFTAASPTSLAVVRAAGFAVGGGPLQETSADAPAEIKLKAPTELKLKFIGPDGNPVSGMKVWPTYVRDQTPGIGGSVSYVMISENLKDEFTRTTDASGVCTFPAMPQGSMFMYEIGDDRFASQNNAANIKLAAAPTTDGGTIQLELGGSISGKVTSAADGKPVPQMTVMAQGEGTGPTGDRTAWIVNAQTDADGKYIIKKVRSGSYTMRFELTPELTAQFAAPAMETFTMTPGQEVADKNITLVTGGIVKGKVSKAGGGDPIPDVRIYAYSIDNNQGRITSQANAITKADGTYTMHVTPGQQQVSLSGPAPAGFMMPRNNPVKRITVADGQSAAADFELLVNPNPPIKGHVVDAQGAPVAGANILLENAGDQQNYSPMNSQARSDKDGAFTIPGVADSTAVRARKGTMSTVKAVFVTSQNRQDLKITVQKDAVASARVKLVDPAGKPIPDGQVSVMQNVGNSRYSTQGGTTGPDGISLVSSLYPDSTYSISARAKGYGSGTANLTLQPGATVDVSVSLIKADSFVAGMVLDENQLPLADTDVYASGSRANAQGKTDITGHFRINNLVPGDTLQVYTRAGNRMGQQQPERVPAGTDTLLLIHNPTPPTPTPTSRPAAGR